LSWAIALSAGPAARSRPTNKSAAHRFPLELQAGHDGGDQGRQVEVDRQPGDADRAQRVDRQQHGFGIRFGRVDAQQLATDLGELPLGLQRIAAHADHVAAVGEAQWPRLVFQSCHGDACYLHRHVGPHAHHALRHRVHQPEGLRGERRARAAQQRFLELDHRRFHPIVTECGEALDRHVDGIGLARGVGWQKIGQSGGQQAAMVVVVHAHGAGLSDCDKAAQR
jgi:hypothetical protein